jgi:hypothetical protein
LKEKWKKMEMFSGELVALIMVVNGRVVFGKKIWD